MKRGFDIETEDLPTNRRVKNYKLVHSPQPQTNLLKQAQFISRTSELKNIDYWVNSSLGLAGVEAAIKGSAEGKLRGYADGGYYSGGLAMVGENGPELINFNDPGMVYNASQTSRILTGGDDVVVEIRNLREENKVQSRALVNLQNRVTRLLERWDGDGLPETRVVTA